MRIRTYTNRDGSRLITNNARLIASNDLTPGSGYLVEVEYKHSDGKVYEQWTAEDLDRFMLMIVELAKQKKYGNNALAPVDDRDRACTLPAGEESPSRAGFNSTERRDMIAAASRLIRAARRTEERFIPENLRKSFQHNTTMINTWAQVAESYLEDGPPHHAAPTHDEDYCCDFHYAEVNVAGPPEPLTMQDIDEQVEALIGDKAVIQNRLDYLYALAVRLDQVTDAAENPSWVDDE